MKFVRPELNLLAESETNKRVIAQKLRDDDDAMEYLFDFIEDLQRRVEELEGSS